MSDSVLFISELHPAKKTAMQISVTVKVIFLKAVTNLSDYSIKETRPHKKSRFVHQFIPKGYNACLVVQFFAHLFSSIKKLLYDWRWIRRMENSIGYAMIPFYRYNF